MAVFSGPVFLYPWHPTPVLLPGKPHGWKSLVGCSPWGRWGSDTTERLHFHFSLSCIGEGNGNPLQCSCLENPRGGGAWWAAVYGVAQSQTRLKWLSSSRPLSYIMSIFLFFSFLGGSCMRLLYNQHGISMNRIAFNIFSGFINFLFLRLLLPRLLWDGQWHMPVSMDM